MRKLLSMLIAAVFTVSMGSVFAASHMKAAAEKTDEVKTGEMKKVAMTSDEKKAAAKEAKEAKAAKKAAAKEAKAAKKAAAKEAKAAKKDMKKEETK